MRTAKSLMRRGILYSMSLIAVFGWWTLLEVYCNFKTTTKTMNVNLAVFKTAKNLLHPFWFQSQKRHFAESSEHTLQLKMLQNRNVSLTQPKKANSLKNYMLFKLFHETSFPTLNLLKYLKWKIQLLENVQVHWKPHLNAQNKVKSPLKQQYCKTLANSDVLHLSRKWLWKITLKA